MQSSRFLNICRIKSALSESKSVSGIGSCYPGPLNVRTVRCRDLQPIKVFSFWDTRQAWQSSSQRVGINFENVNFISNELLVEFDWSNSAKSSLDGLFERISKIGTDVIILDGVNLLANLGKLFENSPDRTLRYQKFPVDTFIISKSF